MARPLPIEFPGTVYHVTDRGIGQPCIVQDEIHPLGTDPQAVVGRRNAPVW